MLCILDSTSGGESRENRTYIGAYAWSGMALTGAWLHSSGAVELKCVSSRQWHSGTPEMNAIKVGALRYPN